MGISQSPCVGYSWWKFITKNWVVYSVFSNLWDLKLLKFWISVVMSTDHSNLLSCYNSWENMTEPREFYLTPAVIQLFGGEWNLTKGSLKFRGRKLVSEWLPGLRNYQCVRKASYSISHMSLNAEVLVQTLSCGRTLCLVGLSPSTMQTHRS